MHLQYPTAGWLESKNEKSEIVSGKVWGLLHVVSVNPIVSESTCLCTYTMQIRACQTDIVQHDGSLCNKKCGMGAVPCSALQPATRYMSQKSEL